MPEADAGLINDFHNVGYHLNYGNGPTPITWGEIKSYSDMRHTKLSMWESEQLIMMSREYCSWLIKAKDLDCEAPWHSENYNVIESTAPAVNSMFAAMRAAAKANKPA